MSEWAHKVELDDTLGKVSNGKSGETFELVQSQHDPLAGLGLFWTWDFIEMVWPPPKINLRLFLNWDFFEAEWPPKKSSKKVE